MQYLTIWDLILTPVYLIILIYIAKSNRDKKYPPGHPLRTFYLPGLLAKFGGVIFIALIFQFYYNGGDTYNFFYHSQVINSALGDSISTWFDLLLRKPVENNPEIYKYASQMFWYDAPSEYTVGVLGAIFGLLNGTTYIPVALLFAYFSYSGIWAMYSTFTRVYPTMSKPLAYAFLFIPSTIVWGSAIFKDTICMFALGWMTHTTFRIFVDRDFSFKNLFLLVFCFYLIAIIKLYILLGFLPALSLWLLMTYSRKIKSSGLRWLSNIFFIGITAGGFFFFADKFAEELNKYSLEKISRTIESTQEWTTYAAGDEGSVYDLGQTDGSLVSLFSKAPQAVVVTLFRPFPWESRKIIILLSALESLIFTYLTLRVFFKRRGKPFKIISNDPNLIFFLVFSIIFAFAVGISSGNFGALSRYKIPCLPFYAALLMVLQSKQSMNFTTKKLISRRKISSYPEI